MPKPKSNETQEDFHDRCMSQLVGEEGYDQEQANAICYSKWERRDESIPSDGVELVEAQERTELPETGIILEKGDRFLVYTKLSESDLWDFIDDSVPERIAQSVVQALEEKGAEYAASELGLLLTSIRESLQKDLFDEEIEEIWQHLLSELD